MPPFVFRKIKGDLQLVGIVTPPLHKSPYIAKISR